MINPQDIIQPYKIFFKLMIGSLLSIAFFLIAIFTYVHISFQAIKENKTQIITLSHDIHDTKHQIDKHNSLTHQRFVLGENLIEKNTHDIKILKDRVTILEYTVKKEYSSQNNYNN